MRILSTYCIITVFLFSACEDPDPVFPEEVVLSCQEDVDMIAPLLLQGVFDALDPIAAFRGNVTIESNTGSCGSPITDLSFFEAYRFWLGSLTINSTDITDLDFLSTIEQFRGGLTITNCDNLDSISLPSCALIEEFFTVTNNPILTDIQIGQDLDEDIYEEIDIDSMVMVSNPALTSWRPGLSNIDFVKTALIRDNTLLTDLSALSNLSMPSTTFDMEMYGATINESGENMDTDSLNMPSNTFINAVLPNNDYSWLSKAIVTPRFNDDGVNIGRIDTFRIFGQVSVPELCPLVDIAASIGLEVVSNVNGTLTNITPEQLEMECPE